MHEASYSLEAFARTLAYVPVLFVIGATTFHFRYAERPAWLTRFAFVASIALGLALAFRAGAYSFAAFGEDAFSWDSIRTIALESRWGARWRWQVLSAIAAAVSFGVAFARPALGWALASLACLALCASLPLTGHAMALGASALALQAVHVAGAGAWVGTLMVMAISGQSQTAFQRFAPIAITGAVALAATGSATAWLALPSFESIWQSPYGRLLLLKMLSVAAVLGCGFLNWRHFRAQTPSGQRWVAREVALATLVLGLTGWLSETGTP